MTNWWQIHSLKSLTTCFVLILKKREYYASQAYASASAIEKRLLPSTLRLQHFYLTMSIPDWPPPLQDSFQPLFSPAHFHRLPCTSLAATPWMGAVLSPDTATAAARGPINKGVARASVLPRPRLLPFIHHWNFGPRIPSQTSPTLMTHYYT